MAARGCLQGRGGVIRWSIRQGGMIMASETKVTTSAPQSRHRLSEVSWQELNQPGAYVEAGSGDLYRIPKEALLEGASPLIRKESLGSSTLVQVSKNPFITTLEARMIACENNISPKIGRAHV